MKLKGVPDDVCMHAVAKGMYDIVTTCAGQVMVNLEDRLDDMLFTIQEEYLKAAPEVSEQKTIDSQVHAE